MNTAKESTVQKELIQRLVAEFPSIYVRKIHQTMYSHSGVPDVLVCLDGDFIAIEVKRQGGQLSKLQDRELKLIRKAGGMAIVCSGFGGIDETIHILRAKALSASAEDYRFSAE